jgi:hypothetical protein
MLSEYEAAETEDAEHNQRIPEREGPGHRSSAKQ